VAEDSTLTHEYTHMQGCHTAPTSCATASDWCKTPLSHSPKYFQSSSAFSNSTSNSKSRCARAALHWTKKALRWVKRALRWVERALCPAALTRKLRPTAMCSLLLLLLRTPQVRQICPMSSISIKREPINETYKRDVLTVATMGIRNGHAQWAYAYSCYRPSRRTYCR